MKYIIEGVKLSGKSSLSHEIWKNAKGSTVLNYRAFTELNDQNYMLSTNLEDKLNLLSKLLESHEKHPFIMTRAHLYPFALAATINKKLNLDFSLIDNKFKSDHTILILLTISKEVYLERLNKRIDHERDEKNWDKNWSNVEKMQSEYLSLFCKSKLNKIIINTSERSTIQTIEEIKNITLRVES